MKYFRSFLPIEQRLTANRDTPHNSRLLIRNFAVQDTGRWNAGDVRSSTSSIAAARFGEDWSDDMAIGGQVVGFVGEVAVFPTIQEAEAFIRQLETALSQHRNPSPNSRTWTVWVTVHLLDAAGIRRHALERNSPPYPGAAVVFLNLGAVHACQEFGIAYPKSDASNMVLPDWVNARIDTRYCSNNPFAGADPCR